MISPFTISIHASDKLLAAASALVLTAVLLATAIVPASPAHAANALSMGVLA